MYDFSGTYLDEAHRQSSYHRHLAQRSLVCGCFYCLRNFFPQQITKWCDRPDEGEGEGVTALCPHCGIDSVLFSAGGLPVDDPDFLRMMYIRWFETIAGPGNGNDNEPD